MRPGCENRRKQDCIHTGAMGLPDFPQGMRGYKAQHCWAMRKLRSVSIGAIRAPGFGLLRGPGQHNQVAALLARAPQCFEAHATVAFGQVVVAEDKAGTARQSLQHRFQPCVVAFV